MSKAYLFSTKVTIFLLIAMSITLFTDNHKAYAQRISLQDILDRVEALEDENAALQAQVAELDAENAALQTRVTELETKTAYMRVETGDINGLLGPHTIFEETNVHVQSGSGSTDDDTFPEGGTLTGLGNLIVGYNEERSGPEATVDRTGSHNLIVGMEHNYSNFGGLVAGQKNSITSPAASVSGGQNNEASGVFASVSGGSVNEASGLVASVSGGSENVASGVFASVSGGSVNQASGEFASVSGGRNRTAPNTENWAAGSLLEPF